MKDELFIIKDLEQFINSTRALVFNSFGENKTKKHQEPKLFVSETEQAELDNILSYQECLNIAKELLKKQKNKKTLKERYLLSNSSYYQYVDLLNQRMIGNILQNLVSKGLVETAFDSETNDFIFWIDNENKEIPETD